MIVQSCTSIRQLSVQKPLLYFNKFLFKALPFLLFYSFPMSIKIWVIRFIVSINLKDKVKRWLHF